MLADHLNQNRRRLIEEAAERPLRLAERLFGQDDGFRLADGDGAGASRVTETS